MYKLAAILTAVSAAAAVIFFAVGTGEPRKNYFGVPLDEIPADKPHVVVVKDVAYLIVRVPEALQSEQGYMDVKKNSAITLPVKRPELEPSMRVFSVTPGIGEVLLPYEKWWKHTVPCSSLVIRGESFEHKGQRIPGGLHCQHSISKLVERKLVYNFQGENLSSNFSNLYIPLYHIAGNELRIGAASS